MSTPEPVPLGGFRSTTEYKFAQYLESVELSHYAYEAAVFQIDAFAHYTPDFELELPKRWRPVYIEVKPTLDLSLADKRPKKLVRIVKDVVLAVWPGPVTRRLDLFDWWWGFTYCPDGRREVWSTRQMTPNDAVFL